MLLGTGNLSVLSDFTVYFQVVSWSVMRALGPPHTHVPIICGVVAHFSAELGVIHLDFYISRAAFCPPPNTSILDFQNASSCLVLVGWWWRAHLLLTPAEEEKGRVEEEEFWVVELPQDISAEKHKSEGGVKSMLKRTSLSDPSS